MRVPLNRVIEKSNIAFALVLLSVERLLTDWTESEYHSVDRAEESPRLSVDHCQQASPFSSAVISRGT